MTPLLDANLVVYTSSPFVEYATPVQPLASKGATQSQKTTAMADKGFPQNSIVLQSSFSSGS